jgi:flotillin
VTALALIGALVILVPILVIIIVRTLYRTPAADQALIITGWGVKGQQVGDRVFKIVTGRGVLVIPGLQRVQSMNLSVDRAQLEVSGVDTQKIPIGVRGVALYKVGDTEQEITNAAVRFLHDQDDRAGQSQMHGMVQEVLHGHMRSIIGGITVEDLIANRNELAVQTRDASSDELQKLGLVLDSLQVSEIIDPTGYITALGEPRTAAVLMDARIAKAARDREAVEREQEAARLVAAANRDTEIARAQYQAAQDKESFKAQQAGPLAQAEATKEVVQTETEVAKLESVREQARLEATVNRQADADAYQARTQANAERDAAIARAEAKARETQLTATANARQIEEIGAAEASAERAKGEAVGVAVRAKGMAEAEALDARAKALTAQSEAVIGQTVAEKLPEIVAAAAGAFGNIDNLTVFNGAEGLGSMLTQIINQVGPALQAARSAIGAHQNGSTPGHEFREEVEQ